MVTRILVQEDDSLIEKFKRGDEAAFRRLYDKYGRSVYFYSLALSGNEHDAEEAAQDVFLVFIKNIDRYRPGGSLKSYLMRSARNRIIDRSRKAAARKRAPMPDAELFVVPDTDDTVRELARLVSGALLSLPPEQREVVVLRIYEDMTFREIAGVVGAPENTVASRFRYAGEKLRASLERCLHADG